MSSTRWTGRIVLTVPPVKIFIASHQSCPILLNVGIPYAKTRERGGGLKTNPTNIDEGYKQSKKNHSPHKPHINGYSVGVTVTKQKRRNIVIFGKNGQKNVFRRINSRYKSYKPVTMVTKKKFSICGGRTPHGYHMFKTASIFCNLFFGYSPVTV